MTSTSTSTAVSPTATIDESDDESGGPTSSPLLFFVALGFGVVFTNLWIIVGVKYCFRYNRRYRQRAQNESGDPIDLTVMQRPHRRRREKKLMSMDEVNERFPLTKYKMWRSSREHEGLPAAGGITQPGTGSRPASIKELNESAKPPESAADASQPFPVSSSPTDKPDEQTRTPTTYTHSHDQASKVSDNFEDTDVAVAGAAANADASEKPTDKVQEEKSGNDASSEAQSRPNDHPETDDEEDEDDPARAPVQQELLDSPGDTCAICLDNLDDDDDVRGLTCGHAFHAGCLDPWLTSRRACCPLCKADYYVPKARPENPAANLDEAQMSPLTQTGSRIGVPVTPRGAMIDRVGGGLPFLTFRPRTNNAANTPTSPGTPVSQQGAAMDNVEAGQRRSGLAGPLFGFVGRFRRNRNNQAGSNLSSSIPQSSRTNPQQLSTPGTPRSPFLTANPNNLSTNTPTLSANTHTTMNVTPSSPSSPSSPSPNWRTRLLSATSPSRRSQPSTDATSSSFVSRLRRGRRDNGNNDNDNDSNNNNSINATNANNGEIGNDTGFTGSSGMGTSTPPILPAPALGGNVGIGGAAGITPSQLEAGVVRA